MMRKTTVLFLVIMLVFQLFGCAPTSQPPTTSSQPSLEAKKSEPTPSIKPVSQPFTLSSSVLEAENMIPTQNSCNGKDISLALAWGDPPAGTKSFTLIMDDPDAKAVAGFVWIHWVIFNIPPQTRTLAENLVKTNPLADGSIQGKNSFGKIGYGGPCPPSGLHHYVFKLFALDIMLNASPGATSGVIIQKMNGHILAQTELVTTYRKH
jgi:Raf kinase inhibitor-like YbhB/YbcL family protein